MWILSLAQKDPVEEGMPTHSSILAWRIPRILGWEDALEEGMTTSPVFLPKESCGQRSLVGYSP